MPASPQAELLRKRQLDRNRLSASKRGYGRDWQRVRKLKLESDPLCEPCKARGKLVSATVVDHIQAIEDRPDLRLDPDNLKSCCKPCHDRRTAADQGFNVGKNVKPVSGADASGMPTDPNHPWRRGYE